MDRRLMLVAGFVVALLVVGCNRKTTKVEEPVPPPAAPVQTAPTQNDSDRFDIAAFDEEARQNLQTIYFDYDRSELRRDEAAKLETAGRFLSQNGAIRVLLEGHADERGSSEYNIGLGDRRAKSIDDWLVSFGIDRARIERTSYGRERPANPNCGGDDPCHALNRRVEFKVLK